MRNRKLLSGVIRSRYGIAGLRKWRQLGAIAASLERREIEAARVVGRLFVDGRKWTPAYWLATRKLAKVQGKLREIRVARRGLLYHATNPQRPAEQQSLWTRVCLWIQSKRTAPMARRIDA